MSAGEKTVQEIDELRMRAQLRLGRGRTGDGAQHSAAAALSVLHELASSPTTAADALTLLHELQVHQVELALQDEELRVALARLEGALGREQQRYALAPVAQYCIDRSAMLLELNVAGVQLLEREREALFGQALTSCLVPESAALLRAALARLAVRPTLRLAEQSQSPAYAGSETLRLQLAQGDRQPREVCASIGIDPAQPEHFLVAMMPTLT